MRTRFTQAILLIAATLALPAYAADTENGPIANGLLAGFEQWLAPKLSGGLGQQRSVSEGRFAVLAPASGVMPAAGAAKPSSSLRDEQAKLNYHGAHFAVAVLDAGGHRLALRPFSKGFKSGERFKLRMVASFAGTVQIENINPQWERKQIYPPAQNGRMGFPEGQEIWIPAGKDEYFEFTKTAGEEQLVVTVQDACANEMNSSHSRVYRQDRDYGSNFIQEAAFDACPVISAAVKLMHN